MKKLLGILILSGVAYRWYTAFLAWSNSDRTDDKILWTIQETVQDLLQDQDDESSAPTPTDVTAPSSHTDKTQPVSVPATNWWVEYTISVTPSSSWPDRYMRTVKMFENWDTAKWFQTSSAQWIIRFPDGTSQEIDPIAHSENLASFLMRKITLPGEYTLTANIQRNGELVSIPYSRTLQ